jgi:hypothetical protein
MTITILYYSPGQKATIFLETLDGYGQRADGYTAPDGYPFVSKITFPDLSLAPNFPKDMTKLSTGLYYFQFTLPTTASAIGSYLIDVTYNQPNTSNNFKILYQLVVTAPFGTYTATTQ